MRNVTVGSIRWRILKAQVVAGDGGDPGVVTVGSIRWRILKGILNWALAGCLEWVTVGSIRWRILKVSALWTWAIAERLVTVGSIRWRILKGLPSYPPSARSPWVTVGSIRWRILKAAQFTFPLSAFEQLQWARSDGGYWKPYSAACCTARTAGYSGLDPMEDTERCLGTLLMQVLPRVTVGSIRWRILKVPGGLESLLSGTSC